MNSNFFMQKAIDLSIKNIYNNGGPFGCVIVKNNKIISEGVNSVTQNNDPTAHAEIVAIRSACKILNNFDLSGCELYTSCEPCPMCLSAIYWSHIDLVYYGNSRENAAEIDFDDKFIYDEIKKEINKRKIPLKQVLKEEAIKAFNLWTQTENKTKY
ncbi:MAG: nucleoside deaminase [Alphaproteobacteria bacterium]|nr:nucleoside deaminase [Alphaproteobacteria bacterium]